MPNFPLADFVDQRNFAVHNTAVAFTAQEQLRRLAVNSIAAHCGKFLRREIFRQVRISVIVTACTSRRDWSGFFTVTGHDLSI